MARKEDFLNIQWLITLNGLFLCITYRHIDERTNGDPVMAFMDGEQAGDYRGARFLRIPDAYG